MSKLLSFVAGAAKGFSEMVDASEKSAKEEAALRVSRLMATHKEVMESNLKLENELKAEEGWIKTYFSNATPEQIQFLQANPPALQAIKSMDNPTQLGDLGNIIKIANANKAASVTQDQITQLPIVAAEVTSRLKEKARSTGFFRSIADAAGERVGTTTERSLARGLGTTVEQMESIKRTARPSIEGTFDVAKTLEKPKEFKELKDQAQVELLTAQESNNPEAVNAAAEKVARINTIEAMGKVEKKTEAQIQSDLITEIQQKQAANDKQGAATATALLRQRQALMKAPGAEGKKDSDDITQTNLIQVATRTRATTIEQELPPGQLITSTDAQGNVTMTLRDLTQADRFRRGDAIAANAIIKEMTKPDGMPRSEKHKNAMMSAGIRFDDAGKAIKPIVPELPVKGVKGTPPPPPPPPTAASAAPSPAPALPATTRGGAAPAVKPAPPPAAAKPVLKWNPKTNSWE
jgi:hypothetical protein